MRVIALVLFSFLTLDLMPLLISIHTVEYEAHITWCVVFVGTVVGFLVLKVKQLSSLAFVAITIGLGFAYEIVLWLSQAVWAYRDINTTWTQYMPAATLRIASTGFLLFLAYWTYRLLKKHTRVKID